jgi:hypothetical protein
MEEHSAASPSLTAPDSSRSTEKKLSIPEEHYWQFCVNCGTKLEGENASSSARSADSTTPAVNPNYKDAQ